MQGLKKFKRNITLDNSIPDVKRLKTSKENKKISNTSLLSKKYYDLSILQQIKNGVFSDIDVSEPTYNYITEDNNLTNEALKWLDELHVINPNLKFIDFVEQYEKLNLSWIGENLTDKVIKKINGYIEKENKNINEHNQHNKNIDEENEVKQKKLNQKINELIKLRDQEIKTLNTEYEKNEEEINDSYDDKLNDVKKNYDDYNQKLDKFEDDYGDLNSDEIAKRHEQNKQKYDESVKKINYEKENELKTLRDKKNIKLNEIYVNFNNQMKAEKNKSEYVKLPVKDNIILKKNEDILNKPAYEILKELNFNDLGLYPSFVDVKGKISINDIPKQYKEILEVMNLKRVKKPGDNKYVKKNKLTEEGKKLYYELTGKQINTSTDETIDEQIDNMKKEIKNIENLNIENVENANIANVSNLTLNKINEINEDIKKLIKVDLNKNQLVEILTEMKKEIPDDENIRKLKNIIDTLILTINENRTKKGIQKALNDFKQQCDDLKKQFEDKLNDLTVRGYIYRHPELSDEQKNILLRSDFPEYEKINREYKGAEKENRNNIYFENLYNFAAEEINEPRDYRVIKDIDDTISNLKGTNSYWLIDNDYIKLVKTGRDRNITMYNKQWNQPQDKRKKWTFEDIKKYYTLAHELKEGEGLSLSDKSQINALKKRIEELENVVFGLHRQMTQKTNSLMEQITTIKPTLKHVEPKQPSQSNQFEPNEIQRNLNEIMNRRRKDIEPDDYSDDYEQQWAEGLIDIDDVIKKIDLN